MAKKSTILGNYHYSTSNKHPKESVGNQQVFNERSQVGALEYIPDKRQGFRIDLTNTKGKKVTSL